MEAPQKAADLTPGALAQRVVVLEAAILEKDAIILENASIILEKTAIISENADAISMLSAKLQAEQFKYAQLQRMIFGSKRERFISLNIPD